MRRRPAHWIPPGPLPAGPQGSPLLRPQAGESLDCIAGHWKIFQLNHGHRYSTDDLLTAWFAVQHFRDRGLEPRSHLDLGCGIGSVGLLTLWSFPRLRLLGIEAQAVSVGLARRSVRYNGVAQRAEIRLGDFRSPEALDPAVKFDLVTGSPPYLKSGEGRRSRRDQKGPCRFEDRGGVAAYLARARAHLAAGGTAVWVHATRYREEIRAAARKAGFGSADWREVVFREGKESLICLFRAAVDAGRGRTCLGPLTVRSHAGTWTDDYAQIRAEMGFPV